MSEPRSLCEAFQATAAREPGTLALRSSDGEVEITWAGYADRVRALAGGLAALGVKPGDAVALMMANRPEFHLVDTAALHAGATPFSVYNTLPPDEIAYLFANAGTRVAICDLAHLPRVQAAGGLDHIVVVEGAQGEGTTGLDELEATPAPDGFDFEATWRTVGPDDVLTLIYTSGTTGPPKGVELTHANMLAECASVAELLSIEFGDTTTSYLPSAHIADRWSAHYNSLVRGVVVTTVADARTVAQVLPQVRPTIWGGVPRVLEKLKSALEAGIAADPEDARREAVQGAIATGIEVVRLRQAGEAVPDELAARHAAMDERVLGPLRARIGLDQVKWICVGAAPLSRDVHEFLLGIGLPVVELYGMSECSCVITTVDPAKVRVGTVGHAISCVELQVADDGEMLVRGPTVMRGYRGEPDKTAEALDPDGWLHTGDIVEIDADGFVKIVDRKKELIINAGGKNMSPANIEQHLKDAHPLIGQAIAIGDARPYNVALLVLDPDACGAYAAREGLDDASPAALLEHEPLRDELDAAVEAANEKLARVAQIKRYEVLGVDWLPGGDELTPTMKLKRKPIAAKYAEQIEALYAAERV